MKQNYFLLLSFLTLTLSSCELAGDIFQAGIWTAVIVIVLVIALILWLVNRFRK